jgi:lauroyl/myristoyl acyltransferase
VGCFHYGNFEWLSLASSWVGFPSDITAQEFKNPLLDRFFRDLREQSGHKIVLREGAIVRLYKTLRRKGRVALLVDLTLRPSDPTVVIECFGLQTIVTVAHAWLQERTGAPIIPIHCEPLPDGRYRIVAHPKIQPPAGTTHQEIAQACWDLFEPTVRKNPAPWLWMYKHWRYKPAVGAERYPFYAGESRGFDQIASRPNYAKLEKAPIRKVLPETEGASPSPAPRFPTRVVSQVRLQLKDVRHRVEFWGVRWLAVILPRLPRRVCHILATGSGAAAAFIHLPGRQVALSNLEAAFGAELTVRRRKQLVRESYQHFARAMADLFWSPRLTAENLEAIFDLEDLEQLKRDRGTDRATIFACLHYAGFEWIALALGRSGFDCTVVTQGFKNPLLNGPFNRMREVSGHQTIRRHGAILRLYKALRNERSVTLAVDLTVSAKLPSVPITCFGMQTCVTFAHAWLHKRTGAPIIPAHCEPLPGGRYRLVLHPALEIAPGATHQQIAQACWDRFEPIVRGNPAPWLWMYKHWRYRPARTPRPYPHYANESPNFRELLARVEKEKAARARTVAAL